MWRGVSLRVAVAVTSGARVASLEWRCGTEYTTERIVRDLQIWGMLWGAIGA